ncbi:MAG: hypothetical protein KOO60_13745 [Gemmatimonadales bacterium]|nr:hypothetical protein [Gemmatimonadales bacterium]
MPRTKSSLLKTLSTADFKRLLAARERIDTLEKEKAQLVKSLSAIDDELAKLMAGEPGQTRKKRAASKKVRGKSTGRKKTARVKASGTKTLKKVVRKKAAKKKAAPKKSSARKAAVPAKGKIKLEDVVVRIINRKKGPVAFKDLYSAIVKGKLFTSKSNNFDNVLRRTLSTSKKVKRVGRGLYNVA